MQTIGTVLVAIKRCSPVCMSMPAHGGCSAYGSCTSLLYGTTDASKNTVKVMLTSALFTHGSGVGGSPVVHLRVSRCNRLLGPRLARRTSRWLGKPTPMVFDEDVSTTARRWEAWMTGQDDNSAAGDWRRSVSQTITGSGSQSVGHVGGSLYGVSAGTYRDQYVKDGERGVGIGTTQVQDVDRSLLVSSSSGDHRWDLRGGTSHYGRP